MRVMSYTEKWKNADESGKYKIREQSALRAKIQHLNSMYWREGETWKYKVNDELFSRPTKLSAIEACLEAKYGILITLEKESPLTYTKHLDSKPILNDELFAASVDNNTMAHIKGLTPTDWQVIYQLLGKAAYHKDPAMQVPAALQILKKLNSNAK